MWPLGYLNHSFKPTHILKFQNSIDFSLDIFCQVPDALPIQLFNIYLHCEVFSYYVSPLWLEYRTARFRIDPDTSALSHQQ